MIVAGASQREVAQRLDLTQPAISYLVSEERTNGVRPSELLAAGGPILLDAVKSRGFTDLAVFGSAARGDDRPDSDVDLLVVPPDDADLFDMIRLEDALSKILGKGVDLVSHRSLDPQIDKDILNDEVPICEVPV